MDDQRRRPPVRGPLGRLAERAYRFELDRRNARFDRGAGVTRLDRPVLSIGNLSVGGTGKTPTVAWVVERLLEAGRRPCIAMRGYKRRNAEHSDEERLYRDRFPEVPVVARPDRIGGLRALFAEASGARTDCVVLDDGFQHRRLARDLDVVLLDASRPLLRDRCLPAGWLREPIGALARADAIVLTHTERADRGELEELRSVLMERFGEIPLAVAHHAWESIIVEDDGQRGEHPVGWLAGGPIVAACAIGHPRAFIEMARAAAGGELAGTLVMPDHAAFTESRIEHLADLARDRSASAILVTEKDWAKLRAVPPARWPCPIARPRLTIRFAEGGEALGALVLERAAGAGGSAGRR